MPFEYQIDPRARRGLIRLHGSIGGDDIVEMLHTLYEHPDWVPGFHTLWDCRDITNLMLSPHDTERVIAAMRALEPRMGAGRTAFLVAREIDYIITRLIVYRGLGSHRERHVFTSFEEADAWLDEADGRAA